MSVSLNDIAEYTGTQSRDDILALIEKWKPLLGLHNWKVKVKWETPLRGKINAEIVVSDKMRSAVIVVNKDFDKWSDYWAETTIIHELMHCLHKATDLVWEKAEVTDIEDDNYVTEMERFIDQLACRIYDIHYQGEV